jgi:tetratricopeptide (TPR) repeat protein/TolB-like protein
VDRHVGKHKKRRGKTASKSAWSSDSAIADETALETPRPGSTASTSGRARLRVGVLSFAASGSERSENFAFALGQEITAALGRLRCFDVIAGMSANSAVPTFVVREHQFRRIDLDYLVDLTLSENGQGTEVKVRLLDLSGNAEAIWSKRLDLTHYGVRQIGDLVATHVLGRVDPGIPLIAGDLNLRERHGASGFLRRAIVLMASTEREKFQRAGQLINCALKIDPDDAEIAAWAARWQYFNITLGYGPHSQQEFVKVQYLSLRAMKLNPDNAEALGMYAHYCAFLEKEFDTALHYFDRSLRINPSLAFIWGLSGPTYCYVGEPRMALQCLDHYRELAPFDPYMSCFELLYAMAYLFNEDYERAAMAGRSGVEAFPDFVNGYKPLVAALGHLGRREEAKPYVDKLLRLEPGFTVEKFAEVYPIKKAADRKRYMEGLREAGIPAR